MGREIYTFKINGEKIRDKLVGLLKISENKQPTFADYIFQNIDPNSYVNRDYKTDLYPYLDINRVISSLEDFENSATSIGLGIAFKFIWKIFNFGAVSEEVFVTTLDDYGFEQIYETGEKNECWVYGNQMAEYGDLNFTAYNGDSYDGAYFLHNNDFYKRYLAYLLMLLSKICLDKQYTGPNHDINYSAEELAFLTSYESDELLEQQTEEALNLIRIENREEDLHEENNSDKRRSAERSHYYVAYHMFRHIKEVQQKLKGYHGKIFIFDNI